MLSRNEEWMGAWVGDELMMMNGQSGAYLALSETGGRIWELVAEAKTLGQLCQQLAAEYSIDEETARLELTPFLEEMVEDKTIYARDVAAS